MAATVGGAFLSAFFEVIFTKLASPEVVNFIRGKKLDPKLLQRLETTLKVVRAVLNDAEKKQIRDVDINKWVDDLKDAVYMADDFLDEVSIKAATTQKEVTANLFSRFFHVQDRDMASRLENIVDRLEYILKLKDSLDLKEIATENLSSRTPSTSLQDGFRIFGREEDKEALMKLLLDDNWESEQVSVIPLVGMGGVGKTTLAQMLYNDDNLKGIFDFKAWVCVSEALDILRVTNTLTEAVTKNTCEMKDLNLVQENLLEILKVRKFLIILDDVWIEDYVSWNLLRKPLLRGIRGSKILVTTRSEKVASIVQTVCPYHLNQLSDEDCWFVFANHACLSSASGENAVSLEIIGRMIVKKCKGLPLAAQSLGSLLRRKHDIKDWNNILNSDIWELSESESKIIPALRISYNYLPPHLKRCFVYCSLFPKDYEFVEDELILLWMAEDLLPPPKTRMTLEEVGYECFDYLVSSSFLQRSNSSWRELESFVMHDLMHDLVTLLGGEFYSRLEGSGEEIKINDKTRHFYGPLEGFEAFDRAKSLRTLLLTKCSKVLEDALHTELLKLKYLRVLSVRAFYNPIVLPSSAGTLIHLRYLDFSTTFIKSLPESVCNLYNLQTLKLDYCYELTMLPSGMQNLLKLRRLGIDETPIKEMPKGMGKLNQLQHLPYYIVGKDEEANIKELGGLSNLHGYFSVKKLENVVNGSEALGARMMDKKHISSLELQWSSNEDCINSGTEMNILCNLQPHQNLQYLDICGYRGTKFPDWLGSSYYHNMNSLRLSSCKNCCILPSLGHLPSLKHLYISDFDGLEIIDSSFFMNYKSNLLTPFPSLESLKFERMPCWEVWSSFKGHAFPRLKHLSIKNCPKLRGDLPSDLPALEILEIEDCEQLVCFLLKVPVMWHLKIVKANKVFLQESPLTIEYLRLCDCSSEMSFPGDCFPASLKTLDIKNCRKLDFPKKQQTHELQLEFLEIHSSCDSLTSFPLDSFPNLKELYISNCENLESLSVSLSQDVSFQNLIDLEIDSCPNLVSLAGEGLTAPSLTRIVVSDCDKLNSLPRMNTLLPKLKDLWIHNCPRVQSFPEGAPSLREIHTTDCEKLISLAWPSMDMLTFVFIRGPCDSIKSYPREDLLPHSIVSLELMGLSSLETLDCRGLLHLTSLQKLTISNCPKLENMEGEGLPVSLTELRINKCPLLEERCLMKHPQIWPKISHIHRNDIDWTPISI